MMRHPPSPDRNPLIRMMLAYPYDLPSFAPSESLDIRHLSTDALRRHAALALSVNRFDASVDYQAELSRRTHELELEEA